MYNKNYSIYAHRFDICGKTQRVFFDADCIRFCGRDAAEILGFKSGTDAVNRHCPNKVKHPMMVAHSVQIVYASAINADDLENLIYHARVDEPTCNIFETILYADIYPAYEVHKNMVRANKVMDEMAFAGMKQKAQNKGKEAPAISEVDEYDPDMEWRSEKNPIRRMAKRILSGTPLKDGTPMTDLFTLDKETLVHLLSLSNLSDDVCDPYVEALALK